MHVWVTWKRVLDFVKFQLAYQIQFLYFSHTLLVRLYFMSDFRCKQCNQKCKSQGGLKHHVDSKHAPPPAPFYFPPPDPYSFRTPSPPPNPPSPFSPRRTPRRRQNGSPVRLPWSAIPITLENMGLIQKHILYLMVSLFFTCALLALIEV